MLLKTIADKAWMLYFNDYLYKKELITVEHKRKIDREIERLYPDN